MSALVDYQDGAVVSKTIVKKGAGSVTVFAFAEGQGLSEHTVPHDALVQVIDGRAGIAIAGVVHQVGVGEMIVMPANEPHAVQAVVPFKMVLTMIRE